jgi:transcriptional regulator with XRE-family HTH domain
MLLLQRKSTKTSDMDIKSVISKHGYSVNSLAKKMGAWQSAMNNVANGQNPTIGKLKEVAAAMECSWLEFFKDEITADDLRSAFPELLAQMNVGQPAPQPEAPQTATAQADNLPFTNNEPEQQAEKREAVAAIICPHCGEAIKLAVI